jgi:hypothetical protein
MILWFGAVMAMTATHGEQNTIEKARAYSRAELANAANQTGGEKSLYSNGCSAFEVASPITA